MKIAHAFCLVALTAFVLPVAAPAAPIPAPALPKPGIPIVAPAAAKAERFSTDLQGVVVGGNDAALANHCKLAWKCATKKRSVRGVAIEQTVAIIPSGDFARAVFIVAGDKVLSGTGYYRRKDKNRATLLAKSYGTGSKSSKGSIAWISADKKSTAQLGRSGSSFKIVALEEAKSKGAISEAAAQNYQIGFPVLTPITLVIASNFAITLTDHPLRVEQNSLLQEWVEIRNTSRTKTAATELRATLTREGENAPVNTQTFPVPMLNPGASHRIFVPIYNRAQRPGNYRAEVSVGGATQARSLLVYAPAPDLVIREGDVPATAQPSTNINVRVKVWNNGGVAANRNFKVRFSIAGQDAVDVAVNAPLRPQADVWVSARLKFEPTHEGDALSVRARVISDETYFQHAASSWNVRAVMPEVDFANSEKITATIRVNRVECEEEDGSDWDDDSPSLYYAGMHTADPHPWHGRPFLMNDVDTGNHRTLGEDVFPAGDRRRTVKTKERIGLFMSLWDEPWDESLSVEWDYITRTFSYGWMRDHAGQTVQFSELFEADDDLLEIGHATYRVKYQVTIGQVQGVAAPERDPSVFADVNAPIWSGRYATLVDGQVATAELRYAPPTANYPQGRFTGTWSEGGRNESIESTRLIGNLWQFKVGSKTFVGYLVGTLQRPSVAGTMTNNGHEVGFSMAKNL